MVDKTMFSVNDANLTMRIQQAEFYLKEFEAEVKRAQGGSGIFRSKEDALSRIMILNEFAPNDPRVKGLFDRARACIMGSTGNFTDMTLEIPEAGENKVGGPVFASVVEPVALYVPGHVLGLYDPEQPTSGRFVGSFTSRIWAAPCVATSSAPMAAGGTCAITRSGSRRRKPVRTPRG